MNGLYACGVSAAIHKLLQDKGIECRHCKALEVDNPKTQQMRLLIMGCSATKADHPTQALYLYDGPAFRVLRAWMREASDQQLMNTAVWVLSAEHGLIPSTQVIEPYDRRMTKARAEELNPIVIQELAEVVQGTKPSEVFMFLGRDYLHAVGPTTWAEGVPLDVAQGRGIGYKLEALSRWLREVA